MELRSHRNVIRTRRRARSLRENDPAVRLLNIALCGWATFLGALGETQVPLSRLVWATVTAIRLAESTGTRATTADPDVDPAPVLKVPTIAGLRYGALSVEGGAAGKS
jgi:hypothetical protein